MKKLFTIGVFGLSKKDFFGKLIDNQIDTFCDIRRRRGVRGAKYSFVNSNRLQNTLSELGINYYHLLDLSPSNEVREIQKEEDKKLNVLKRERKYLGESFKKSFKKIHLLNYNAESFFDLIGNKAENVILFCVEQDYRACHRSLVADFINNHRKIIQIEHL
jgi:uncharacterized protein (DUF488 family)